MGHYDKQYEERDQERKDRTLCRVCRKKLYEHSDDQLDVCEAKYDAQVEDQMTLIVQARERNRKQKKLGVLLA